MNLHKLRNGRNIAGLERQPAPEELPASLLNSSGQLRRSAASALRPTPYRYAVLMERAKQLVTIAQQIEAAFLSALERRDAEAYNLLKARQDQQLSRAGLKRSTSRCIVARCISRPCTVGRERSRRSASSLTPSLRGPAASAFRIRADRSTDWIVPRFVRGAGILVRFGIVESTSVV